MPTYFDHGYALLIGVDENAVSRFALPAVSKDIAALAAVLTHPERCAYRSEHVKQITGPAATRDGITDGLSWLHEKLTADESGNATVVIYYSGHGWRTNSGGHETFYLIPYNVKEIGLAASALSAQVFADTINELHPRRLFVTLDCCHAAGMGVKEVTPLMKGYTPAAAPLTLWGDGNGVTPTNLSAKGVDALQNGAGRAILSSSLGDQRSYLRKDGAMSIFTYHLIEALTGHAQPAIGATEVLVSDIVSHVHRRVPASAQSDWQAAQTPDYLISGNFPVAHLLGGKGLAKGATAPDPLRDLPAEPTPRTTTTINTGGGTYIRGNVRVDKGDFIGRDKITYGDDVRGDKITTGNLTGNTGVAIGSHARTTTVTTSGGAQVDQLFSALLALAQVAPPAQRPAIQSAVQAIQREATQGAQANDQHLARQIEQLTALLPGAAAILTLTFNQPALAPAIGPVTRYVLSKLAE